MSCERIRGRDFHSPAARHYTEQAVEELERSEAFQRYVRHVEYSDRLFLTWFLVPFGLTAALYFHLLQFDGAVPLLSSATESPQGLSAVLIVSALVLALYLLPCAVVAPFAGFFDIPDRAESRSLLALFTVVNLFVVSSGATWLNHPPFLETTPPVPWLSGGVPISSALLVAMRRAAPLQGLLVSAYLVSTWRRAFWRTSWHPPFPLLTVPVAVGACGAVTWRLCSVMMPFWCTSDGHFSRALHITVDEGLDLPSSTISMWQFIASRVVQQLMKDADELLTGRLAAKLQVPGVAVELFLAAFSLSFVYFFLVLVKPVVDGLLSLVTSHILPSDPTTWGLALGSCGSALILLLRTENVPPAIVLTVIALCYALLHNGFVA